MEGCSRQREQPVQSPAGFRGTPGKLPSGVQRVSCADTFKAMRFGTASHGVSPGQGNEIQGRAL